MEDKQDFTTKLIALQGKLYNFAYKLANNYDDANDLLQETMMRAFTNQDKYESGTNFEGWIFTIMRNTFINEYRRIIRHNTIVDTTENMYLLDSVVEGFDSTSSVISHNELMEGINSLNNELRVPFVMYIKGFKYTEIAEHMNIPLGTIKSRIHSARIILQDMFKEFQYVGQQTKLYIHYIIYRY